MEALQIVAMSWPLAVVAVAIIAVIGFQIFFRANRQRVQDGYNYAMEQERLKRQFKAIEHKRNDNEPYAGK